MHLSRYKKGDIDIIEIGGKLEDSHSQEFIDYIDEIISAGSSYLIIDMNSLDYISSSGLGAISAKHISLSIRGGKLILTQMKPNIEKVFQITRILRIIPNYPTLKDALEDLERQKPGS